MELIVKHFNELSVHELYEILNTVRVSEERFLKRVSR